MSYYARRTHITPAPGPDRLRPLPGYVTAFLAGVIVCLLLTQPIIPNIIESLSAWVHES